MQSTIDISSQLFQIIDVPSVNNEITGKIYIGDAPSGSQGEDITIKVLNNPNNYLQNGFMNLNIFCFQSKSGRANFSRFKELLNIIIPLVKDVSVGGYHFQIDDDKGIFRDTDNDGMYFYNLRLEFQTLI